MPYFAPYIDSAGLHIPTYQDILEYFISNAKNIFGQDIYLDVDSADYQQMSIQALAYSDAMQSLQFEYNNRSPHTAIGTALDSLLKLNGITRKKTGFSTVVLSLTGKPNYTINNCIAGDINGNKWLITTAAFDDSGNASVSAVCQSSGAVVAPAETITEIVTPTLGWLSVTNTTAAIVGNPVESDSVFRSRQAISTQLSSETLLSGTEAALAALNNINRYKVYENNTSAVDANGITAHSISAVVEGGLDYDVANAIYSNKGLGCGTYGTTHVAVNDPSNNYSNTINFYRIAYTQIFSTVQVHPLTGWNDSMLVEIQNAILLYLNSLKIGQSITVLTGVLGAVLSVLPDPSNPAFSVQLIKAGSSADIQNITDIAIGFNHVAQSDLAKILVTLV